VAEDWLVIELPSFAQQEVGLERVAEGKGTGSLRKLLPLFVGCLASYGACTGARSLEEILASVPGHVRDYGLISGMSFDARLDRAHRRRRST
jgi:hypothetical protein